MKRNPIVPTVLAIAAATASLNGCSMFHSKSDSYTSAAESRPLEVPPDLDSPPTANELIVPPPGAGASASAAPVSGAPPSAGVAPVAAPPTSSELRVETDVQSAWLKVGAALDSARLGSVSARDAGAHTYLYAFDAPVNTNKGETHWYSSIASHLGFGDPVKAQLTIRIADEGGASRVSVLATTSDKASSAATMRIMQELRNAFPGIKVTEPNAPAVAAAPAAAAAPVVAAAPPMAAPPPVAAPVSAPPAAAPVAIAPSSDVAPVGATDLHVADSVPHTWTRVGLALERAQIGTLSARDESAHTYTLDFNGTVEVQQPPAEHHWYTPILHPFGGDKNTKGEAVARAITVRVAEDKGGARVSVQGNASDKTTTDAVQRVVQVLRERLS